MGYWWTKAERIKTKKECHFCYLGFKNSPRTRKTWGTSPRNEQVEMECHVTRRAIGEGHVFYYSGVEDKHEHGVEFLMHKDIDSVMGFLPISGRVCAIRLRASPFNITKYKCMFQHWITMTNKWKTLTTISSKLLINTQESRYWRLECWSRKGHIQRSDARAGATLQHRKQREGAKTTEICKLQHIYFGKHTGTSQKFNKVDM